MCSTNDFLIVQVMAPLTRCRAGHGEAPTDLNAEYYEQRASDGGLIIGEASQVRCICDVILSF